MFEIMDISRIVRALQVNQVLQKYELNAKIIANVNDKGSNLSPMTITTQIKNSS
jgi:hypothetical protein